MSFNVAILFNIGSPAADTYVDINVNKMLITCTNISNVLYYISNSTTTTYINIGYLNVNGTLVTTPPSGQPAVGLFYLRGSITYLSIENTSVSIGTSTTTNFIAIISYNTPYSYNDIDMVNFNGGCRFMHIDSYSSIIYCNVVNCVTTADRNFNIIYLSYPVAGPYLEGSIMNKHVISGCYRANNINIYINGSTNILNTSSTYKENTPLILNSISLVSGTNSVYSFNRTVLLLVDMPLYIRVYVNTISRVIRFNTNLLVGTMSNSLNVI